MTVTEYLNSVPEDRRSDVKKLHSLIRKTVPKLKPEMVNGVIGYGLFPYETKSGCSGTWFKVGLVNRKQGIALYVTGYDILPKYIDKLPKCKAGKCCLTIKNLSETDEKILVKIIKEAATCKSWECS